MLYRIHVHTLRSGSENPGSSPAMKEKETESGGEGGGREGAKEEKRETRKRKSGWGAEVRQKASD